MSEPAPSLDILFLTHNYPRHACDFAGRFLAHLAHVLRAEGRYQSIGVVAPHHAGAEVKETVEDVRIRRFRYAADERELIAYRGDWKGITLFGDRGLWALARFFRMFRREARHAVRDWTPRIVHAHWWVPAGWIARTMPRQIPLVVTLHGSDLRLIEQKPWMRPLAERVFDRAAIVTTVSTWLSESLAARFPQVRSKLRVAPMPPTDAVFTPDPSIPRATDPAVILCVTRFTVQKRNSVLLRALAQLRDAGRSFSCRMVGAGGSEQAAVEAQIAELGLTDAVTLAGAVDQRALADEYRRATLTVLPAIDEGFGMALVEAQLCGCPVVGVRSGGLVDIVADGRTGLLAEPDNPSDLARAIGVLLSDSDKRHKLAVQGQASAQEQFSSKAIASRFADWYDSLTGSQG